jgi:hypothetical protein
MTLMLWTVFKIELIYEFNENPTNGLVSVTEEGGRNDSQCLNKIIVHHFVNKA